MQNTADAPAVGMPATVTYWTDCYPARVTAVSKSGHQITLRALDAVVVSGSVMDGSAEYELAEYPEGVGQTWKATRRPNGIYRLAGFSQGGRISFGRARMYRDPSF